MNSRSPPASWTLEGVSVMTNIGAVVKPSQLSLASFCQQPHLQDSKTHTGPDVSSLLVRRAGCWIRVPLLLFPFVLKSLSFPESAMSNP